ncbi:aminoglycoside phosphotransferase family protein [Solirubrobacter taibaiensis]|nr:aminoglycoside phosphotransferase family protein [Solirubrobacter taibaiensis]
MHVGEVPIDDALVSGLLGQCPELRGPLRAVRSTGTVNAIYRLGDELYVRLPRLEQYAGDLRKECEWLPRLDVSLPIPVPVFAGEPTDEFPFPWAVFRWIEGEPYDDVTDERAAAATLARFVHELRAHDVTEAPAAGRAPLAELDEMTRPLLRGPALAAWERALEAPAWDGTRTWIHADLLRPNVLVSGGALAAVIDFGAMGAGDPAHDIIPAWAIFDPPGRAVFRAALDVDDATWERARGIALHQAAMIIPYYRETNPAFTALAERTVEQLTQRS